MHPSAGGRRPADRPRRAPRRGPEGRQIDVPAQSSATAAVGSWGSAWPSQVALTGVAPVAAHAPVSAAGGPRLEPDRRDDRAQRGPGEVPDRGADRHVVHAGGRVRRGDEDRGPLRARTTGSTRRVSPRHASAPAATAAAAYTDARLLLPRRRPPHSPTTTYDGLRRRAADTRAGRPASRSAPRRRWDVIHRRMTDGRDAPTAVYGLGTAGSRARGRSSRRRRPRRRPGSPSCARGHSRAQRSSHPPATSARKRPVCDRPQRNQDVRGGRRAPCARRSRRRSPTSGTPTSSTSTTRPSATWP